MEATQNTQNEACSGLSYLTDGLGWIDSATKPADHKPVAVIVDGERYKYWARAMWVPKHSLEDNGNGDDFAEYNEADDNYYWPEGWYEWNHAEETHWLINEPVILWAAVDVHSVELRGAPK